MIGPLVNRELLRESRHRLHFVARTLFVLLLGLLVIQILARMPSAGQRGYMYSRPRTLTQADLAPYGARVFAMWALVQYAALCIVSTVRAAQLADERRTGALPLVRATCLQDKGLIRGWYYSVMGRAVFLMLLGVPLLVMSLGFGGFTVTQLVMVVLVTLLAVATGTAMTLAIAARSASTGEALIASFILQALPLLPFLGNPRAIIYFGWLHSLGLLFSILGGNLGRAGFTGALPVLLVTALPIPFIISKLLLIPLFLRSARKGLAREPRRFGAPIKRFLTSLDAYLMRRTSKFGVLWKSGLGQCKGNPILWRERAVSLLGQRDHAIRLTYFPMLLVLAIGLIAAFFGSFEWATRVVLVGLFAIPLLFAISFLAVTPATFIREHQQKTVALLASTPLTARQIVLGKYFFCLGRLIAAFVLCGVFLGLALYFISWNSIAVRTALAAAAFVPLLVAQILYMSAGADSLTKAIPAALIILGLGASGLLQRSLGSLNPYLLFYSPSSFLYSVVGGARLVAQHYMLQIAIMCPLLLWLFMLIPRVRWLANGVPIIVVLILTTILAQFVPGYVVGNMSALVVCEILVAVIFLFALLRWRNKSPRPSRWDYLAWIAYALWVFLGFEQLPGQWRRMGGGTFSGLFADALLLATVIRAASHASGGIFHRTFLALLIPGFTTRVLFHFLDWYAITLNEPASWQRTQDSLISVFNILPVATSVILTILFLRITIRQMDGFLGRADNVVTPEPALSPSA